MSPKSREAGGREWPAHTVHLGRYTRVHANAIVEELEREDIAWWYKEPGWLSNIWEFGGVRLFVDAEHVERAREIATRVLGSDGIPPDAADPGWF